MRFLEALLIEGNNLVKLMGVLTIGFSLGSYSVTLLKLNSIPFIPTPEFILCFCIGYLLVKIPMLLYFPSIKT